MDDVVGTNFEQPHPPTTGYQSDACFRSLAVGCGVRCLHRQRSSGRADQQNAASRCANAGAVKPEANRFGGRQLPISVWTIAACRHLRFQRPTDAFVACADTAVHGSSRTLQPV